MSKPKDKRRINRATVARFLTYDSKTGIFRWREARRQAVKAGDVAGHLASGDGYLTIFIQGYAYKAHRLAWLLYTGKWPKHEIDHINRVRSDNRIENLREATKSQNKINSDIWRNNKSGYKNVHFHKATKKWAAEVKRNGKTQHIGLFVTPEAANLAVGSYLDADVQQPAR